MSAEMTTDWAVALANGNYARNSVTFITEDTGTVFGATSKNEFHPKLAADYGLVVGDLIDAGTIKGGNGELIVADRSYQLTYPDGKPVDGTIRMPGTQQTTGRDVTIETLQLLVADHRPPIKVRRG